MYYSVWLYQWPRVFFWPTMISQIQMQGDHLTTVFSPFSNLALSVRNWGEICLQSLSVSHLHQSWQLLKITLHCSKIIAKLMLVNGQSISNITSFLLKKFQNILCTYLAPLPRRTSADRAWRPPPSRTLGQPGIERRKELKREKATFSHNFPQKIPRKKKTQECT